MRLAYFVSLLFILSGQQHNCVSAETIRWNAVGTGGAVAAGRRPEAVAAGFLSMSDNPHVILLFILILMLIVGMFMDIAAALIILGPILHPIAVNNLGIHPIHFGIMMVLNLCIGLCTPPVGSVLFVGCSIAGTSITSMIRPSRVSGMTR